MKEWCLVLVLGFPIALGQVILDEIQKRYLQQGIPFRENKFLNNLPILPEYDFIVVGSGPAGSAVANRLSEVPQWKILLLEAGLEGNIYNDIPVINELTVLGDFSLNIDLEREDNACIGMVGQRCHWPSGNGVGGASLINGMIFTRGHRTDFDGWADDRNPGWSYDDVLPYFKKLENMSIPGITESIYHSTNGPVHLQYPFQTEIGKLFLDAGKELGYDLIDYNNPNTMIGFSRTQTSIRGVKRESAASAYLLPVKSRPNLHIMKSALVTQVLTDKATKRATGVKFMRKGKTRIVRARKEVVLSAGAFGSPKVLMLSGIGPADHLKKNGIPVTLDLPVGNNLQEHLGHPITFLINTEDSLTIRKLLSGFTSSFLQWVRGESGILSSNIAECLGYVQSKYAKGDRPDVELIFLPTTIASDGGALWSKTRNISKEVFENTFKPIYFKEGFSIAPMVMYPKSRGTLRLKSRNPVDPLVIDANFLSHPDDAAVFAEGARIAVKLATTKAFQKIGTKLYTKPVYGCEEFEFNSDEYWGCAIRTVTGQFHHQCGTCRMGPDPSSSVVDHRLRVHGMKGLRVADASIMPTIPGTHTMAPSYMIGEKAADMIKEDWEVL